MEFELINGSKLEELLTNTVARLVITLPDGTKVELVNESQLREQIAKEIPETIVELIAYWNEQSDWDGFHYITEENFGRILNFVAAAIARGEPNQVTKDAIEEARKMNGETLSDEKLAEIAGQVPNLDANNVRFL